MKKILVLDGYDNMNVDKRCQIAQTKVVKVEEDTTNRS